MTIKQISLFSLIIVTELTFFATASATPSPKTTQPSIERSCTQIKLQATIKKALDSLFSKSNPQETTDALSTSNNDANTDHHLNVPKPRS